MAGSADRCFICSSPFYGRQTSTKCVGECGTRAHVKCLPAVNKNSPKCNTCLGSKVDLKESFNIKRTVHSRSLESTVNLLLEEILMIKEDLKSLVEDKTDVQQLKLEIAKLKEENMSLRQKIKLDTETEAVSKPLTMADVVKKTSKRTENKSTRPPLNYVLIKSTNGDNNVEMDLKKNVNPVQMGINIKTYRKLKTGTIVVGCASKEEAKQIQEEVTKKCKSVKATNNLERNPQISIKNVPEETTTEEIKNVIKNISGEEPLHIKITKGRNKRAICEVIPTTLKQLIEKQTINLGWTRCRIYEEFEISQCFKCWKAGHKQADCKLDEESIKRTKASVESGVCVNCINYKVSKSIKNNVNTYKEKTPSKIIQNNSHETDVNNSDENCHHHPGSFKCPYVIKMKDRIKKLTNYNHG